MISAAYIRQLAAYNQWQNQSIYKAADQITPEQRLQDHGLFFKSVFATLNHILWADRIWMEHFAQTPAPRQKTIAASVEEVEGWAELKATRIAFDEVIINWAEGLSDTQIDKNYSWRSMSKQQTYTKPLGLLIGHMFNHQTHHRGQVNAVLTKYGAIMDDTDLPFMPDNLQGNE
ncbi:MAG: DinB family protein [bacterium]